MNGCTYTSFLELVIWGKFKKAAVRNESRTAAYISFFVKY